MTTQAILDFAKEQSSDSEIFSVAEDLLGQYLAELLENKFTGIETHEGQQVLKSDPDFSSELTSFLICTIAEEFDCDSCTAKAEHLDFLIEWDVYDVTLFSTPAATWNRAIKNIGEEAINRRIRAEYSSADARIDFDKVKRQGKYVSIPVSHHSKISTCLKYRMENEFASKIKSLSHLTAELAS